MKNKLPDHLKEDKSIVFYAESELPMEKCSDEEKEIYGVDFKKSRKTPTTKGIVKKEAFFDSGKVFFEAFVYSYATGFKQIFESKSKAIKFIKDELNKIK